MNYANWIILIVAALFECAWAIGLKYTEGFTRLWPTVFAFGTNLLSVYLLSFSVKTLPVGTAYAVWTGIGAVLTALLGIVLFKEPATVARLVCIVVVIAGVTGLALLER